MAWRDPSPGPQTMETNTPKTDPLVSMWPKKLVSNFPRETRFRFRSFPVSGVYNGNRKRARFWPENSEEHLRNFTCPSSATASYETSLACPHRWTF
jgi:hypothetical protein